MKEEISDFINFMGLGITQIDDNSAWEFGSRMQSRKEI